MVRARKGIILDGSELSLCTERADVLWVERATIVSVSAAQFPRSMFMESILGGCKIPSGLVSASNFARGIREAQYVKLMNEYLRGGMVRSPIYTPGLWSVDFASLYHGPGEPLTRFYAAERGGMLFR